MRAAAAPAIGLSILELNLLYDLCVESSKKLSAHMHKSKYFGKSNISSASKGRVPLRDAAINQEVFNILSQTFR